MGRLQFRAGKQGAETERHLQTAGLLGRVDKGSLKESHAFTYPRTERSNGTGSQMGRCAGCLACPVAVSDDTAAGLAQAQLLRAHHWK